ncbi:glycoside hydrolase family 20 zincin-like fold domain-containing protein [Putridiphycobacter roseus]|nr:glycoside hydrolase family 20 zincin-like fold domain-containing protein [Putridiphycobacter roseus]
MKWSGSLILAFCLLVCFGCCQVEKDPIIYRQAFEINLTPKPSYLKIDSGYFELNRKTVILTWNDSTTGANYLQHLIAENSTFSPEIIKIKGEEFRQYPNYIMLNNETKTIGHEVYSLVIDTNRVAISAMGNQGVLNGMQALKQLFVFDFDKGHKRNNWYLPTIEIENIPVLDSFK